MQKIRNTIALLLVAILAVGAPITVNATPEEAAALRDSLEDVSYREHAILSELDELEEQKKDIAKKNVHISEVLGDSMSESAGSAFNTSYLVSYDNILERQDELKSELAEVSASKEELAAAIEEAEKPDVLTGQDIVDFAKQFEGCPYVYAGNSLTNGTDCSGFVHLVYENFGIDLPRTSWGLASCGTPSGAEDAQPGDILCYSGHVALYIGDGKLIHAKTESTGIIIEDNIHYNTLVSVRRIIQN